MTSFTEAWTSLPLDGFDAITLELCSTWDMFDLGMLSIINAGREGTNRVIESLYTKHENNQSHGWSLNYSFLNTK